MGKEEIKNKEYFRFVQTAISSGIVIIKKHKAAKLLALCMAFGDEPFVFDGKLYRDVITAAMTYKIRPMQVPDDEVSRLINGYYHSLKTGTASWVEEINNEYGTNFASHLGDDGRRGAKNIWQSMHT